MVQLYGKIFDRILYPANKTKVLCSLYNIMYTSQLFCYQTKSIYKKNLNHYSIIIIKVNLPESLLQMHIDIIYRIFPYRYLHSIFNMLIGNIIIYPLTINTRQLNYISCTDTCYYIGVFSSELCNKHNIILTECHNFQ